MNETFLIPQTWFGRALLAFSRLMAGKAGDFALLKADLFGAKSNSGTDEKLKGVVGYRPDVNLEQLSRLENGSFGKAYADYMFDQNLSPFEVSEDLSEIADRNTFAMRYAITHDMFHVLTGFDTSYAGEIGVLSFAVSQNYSDQFAKGLKLASFLYPILSFGKLKSIRHAKVKGEKMGQKANFLLGERLEDYFEENLETLRERLKIDLTDQMPESGNPGVPA